MRLWSRASWIVVVGSLVVACAGCVGGAPDFDGDGVSDATDCAPEDATIFPGAPDPPGDGRDTNCDGVDGVADDDLDGDGVAAAEDCDDDDPTVYPGAVEACDGVDNDCDPETSAPQGEMDADLDGALACEDCDDLDPSVEGIDSDGDLFSPCTGDCDEGSSAVYPGAADTWGEGIDQNCDGVDGVDWDADGYPGNATPPGMDTAVWDCDDFDAGLNRADLDGDGVDTCNGDCDDGNSAALPGATELCDSGADEDCDGDIDEPPLSNYEPNEEQGGAWDLGQGNTWTSSSPNLVADWLHNAGDVDWYECWGVVSGNQTIVVDVTLPGQGNYSVRLLNQSSGGSWSESDVATGSGTLTVSHLRPTTTTSVYAVEVRSDQWDNSACQSGYTMALYRQ